MRYPSGVLSESALVLLLILFVCVGACEQRGEEGFSKIVQLSPRRGLRLYPNASRICATLPGKHRHKLLAGSQGQGSATVVHYIENSAEPLSTVVQSRARIDTYA